MLTEAQTLEKFRSRLHCSQVVLGELAEDLGYDKEEAYRIACPFGGGMSQGETCGCVTGALMAIGMAYGNDQPGNLEQDQRCQEKAKQFRDAFVERNGSAICREILGYDFRDPEQRQAARENGTVFATCPKLAKDAIEIASQLIQEA